MMQDTLLRVFVVTLGLIMCPRDDPGVEEEWDDVVTVGMQKHEEKLQREEAKLDQEMAPGNEKMTNNDKRGPQNNIEDIVTDKHIWPVLDAVTVTQQDSEEDYADDKLLDFSDPSELQRSRSPPETAVMTATDWEEDYMWYIWNICSIISMIRFFRKYLRKKSTVKQNDTRTCSLTCFAGEVPLPDSDTLQSFHSKCVQVSTNKKWRQGEFLEGIANHMVEAMRLICDRNGGTVIEDCQMLDACNIIVPFTPPEPYSFQCLLWNNHASDQLPDMQICGQIKLVGNKTIQNGCHCQSSDADNDTVCLLHCDNEKVKTKMTDVCDGHLCLKNTPFLSKTQVTRWFQSIIKQAWAQISHKYDFELSIRYIDAPGALVVRFRSGKKVCFNMNPVVKFNSDAYFYITPCSPNYLDTCWTLSLTIYEDRLLECLSKHLPENSCHIQTLQIACFLQKQQSALSGSSALNEFHFKTALMHLLLTKDPAQWKPNYVGCRLRDLLEFMERSLEKKLLRHIFIGNPFTQKIIFLPSVFTQAKPVNLFHPLVVHNCIYRNAVMHFKEMLRNSQMLIQDYVHKGSTF